jgi:hypothetical protein
MNDDKLQKYQPPDLPDISKSIVKRDLNLVPVDSTVIPTPEMLRQAFNHLQPPECYDKPYYMMMVELQEEVNPLKKDMSFEEWKQNTWCQEFKRVAAGYIKFTKARDNDKVVWIYTGPVKFQ